MREVAIAVLGRFPDIFNGFKESADRYIPSVRKVFVRDGNLIETPTGDKWETIQGVPPFSNPGYANLAWQASPECDILYCGDDVRFLQTGTLEILQEVAYADSKVGMLSPRIIGAAGNALQTNPNPEGITYSNQRLALICTYIKREVIDTIGYMDPVFGGSYGYDDDDYNYRVRVAGYKLAVTPKVAVEHRHAASTFTRTGPGADCRTGELKFRTKWGDAVVKQIAADTALDCPYVYKAAPSPSVVESVRFRRLR